MLPWHHKYASIPEVQPGLLQTDAPMNLHAGHPEAHSWEDRYSLQDESARAPVPERFPLPRDHGVHPGTETWQTGGLCFPAAVSGDEWPASPDCKVHIHRQRFSADHLHDSMHAEHNTHDGNHTQQNSHQTRAGQALWAQMSSSDHSGCPVHQRKDAICLYTPSHTRLRSEHARYIAGLD